MTKLTRVGIMEYARQVPGGFVLTTERDESASSAFVPCSDEEAAKWIKENEWKPAPVDIDDCPF